MNELKEQLQHYIPAIEQFLTSKLLEETNIEIVSAEAYSSEDFLESLDASDIFLHTVEGQSETDVICILDNVWFAILSSIMLGVDESSYNDVTRDLLFKFSKELKVVFAEKLKEDGAEVEPADPQVYSLAQLEDELHHTEYYFIKMEVEGLSDDKIKFAVAFGNREAKVEAPQIENELTADADAEGEDSSFEEAGTEEMTRMGSHEEVITGRHIEFEEFGDNGPALKNSDGNSMDLLKDVEMNVSVELGRIELPLGKVLQLAKGSVIELEKLAGEPVDILVNGQTIAHGEVVVIDEHFGVRITNLITTHQRLAKLN